MSNPATVKALLFDTFGTVVDWRNSTIKQLENEITPHPVDWPQFVADWRNEYYAYTRETSQSLSKDEFVTIDVGHRRMLDKVVTKYKLDEVWDAAKRDKIAFVWHFLSGWGDEGALHDLKKHFIIGTLSNGNVRLLVDMAKYASLPWDVIFGADVFRAYKPSAEVYLGAANLLGLQPNEIVMVAAHSYDLVAASSYGMQTAYIVRPNEDPNYVLNPGDWDYCCSDFYELFDAMSKKAI
ncbi:HAD-like domain-containing protein [Dipodascopsis tothii]|uniref:HAD-like domain-containing protein n=1 Tax=Dipodascopsis tothii TaxID=44089 RepID=UPI0034CFFBFF